MREHTNKKRVNQIRAITRLLDQQLGQLADNKGVLRVLDIGCGYGVFEEHICRKYGSERITISVTDIEKGYIDKQKGRGCVGETVIHDLNNPFPFRDSSFDLIVASAVIGALHLGREGHFLMEVERMLKPGGRAVIFASNKHILFSTLSVSRLVGRSPWRQFNPRDLKKQIVANNMSARVLYLGSFITLINEYLVGALGRLGKLGSPALAKVAGWLIDGANKVASIEYKIPLPKIMAKHFIITATKNERG